MNRRERLLATIVGLIVVLLVGFYLTEKIRSAFRKRTLARTQVQSELDHKQQIIDRGARAVRDLANYEDISLPSNPELARSQYQAWLSEIVDRVGLKEPQVKVVSQSRLPNDCTQLTCSVNGTGNLRQLTQLLHEFYSVDTIQRIRRLPLRPDPGTKDMKIDLSVEALILSSAPSNKTFNRSAQSELGKFPVEQVIDPIVQRNMFAPANRPPEIADASSEAITKGVLYKTKLAATDPDTLDKLVYELADGPAGLQLDSLTGEISWQPSELGTFSLKVAVHDDGIPVRSAEQTVQFNVVDPPPVIAKADEPAKPKFDDARFTYAIAMLEVAGERQLWLQVRTSGKIMKLSEGDPVKIGSIDATITHIGDRDVELAVDGNTFRVGVGEPLVRAE